MRAIGGGAEVVRNGQVLAKVRPPRAIDAAGRSVPVALKVAAKALVLRVADREADLEYPILVDPELRPVKEGEGGAGTWHYLEGRTEGPENKIVPSSVPLVASSENGEKKIEAPKGAVYQYANEIGDWEWSAPAGQWIKSIAYGYTYDVEPFSVYEWFTPSINGYRPSRNESGGNEQAVASYSVNITLAPSATFFEGESDQPSKYVGFLGVDLDTVVTGYGSPSEAFGARNPGAPDQTRACAGDPVDCASGNLVETQTDLSIGGRGLPLAMTRTYNSAAKATEPGMFGIGWTSTYGDHLVIDPATGDNVTVVQSNGSTTTFTLREGTFVAPSWVQAKLSLGGGVYTYTLPNQTVYKFNGEGLLVSESDRYGNITTVKRAPNHRIESVTDSSGRTLTFAYDAEGLVASVTGPMNHVVRYGYKGDELASVTEPGESESTPRWRFRYNGESEMEEVIDGRGNAVKTQYEAGRVVSQKDALGRETKWKYAGTQAEPETTITEPNGSTTFEKFNELGEPTSTARAFGVSLEESRTTFEYNSSFELIAVTNADKHTTKYGYNAAGDRTSETDALNNERRWEYDSTHDVISTTTPKGEVTTIKRNPTNGEAESIARHTPSGEQTSTYTYYPDGEVKSYTDPLKHTWEYEYDAYGDRTAEVDPVHDKRTWTYNEDSQELSATSPRGNSPGISPTQYTTTIERDEQGRPKAVSKTALRGTVEGTLGLKGDEGPRAIAVSPTSSTVFVADQEDSRVQEYSSTGTFLREFGSTSRSGEDDDCSSKMCEPVAITVDPAGNVWVAEPLEERVREFSELGATETTIQRPLGSGEEEFEFPMGVAVNQAKDVFVSDAGNARILEFEPTAGSYNPAKATRIASSASFNWPQGLALDSSGHLWVADTGDNRVQRCSASACEAFGSQGAGEGRFNWPESLSAEDGYVLVADSENNRISVLAEEGGAYIGSFGTDGSVANQMHWPAGVAFRSPSEALVLDSDNDRVTLWTAGDVTTSTQYGYDPDGDLETVTDPEHHTTTYVYDADDELTGVKEPNGTETETGYEALGLVTSETNGDKQTTHYERNLLGEVTEVIDPLKRTTLESYDPAGNLETVTNPAKQVTTYRYYANNWLAEANHAGVPDIKYEYDADGDLIKTTGESTGSGESKYEYDQLDRLIESKDGHGDKINYEYNLDNEQTKITYPNSDAVTREFDEAGRLKSVKDWLGNATTFSYDPDSDLSATTFPAGTGTSDVDEYGYDNTDAMSAVELRGRTDIATLGYTRNEDEEVSGTVSEDLPSSGDVADEYDANGRVDKAGTSVYEYNGADDPTKTPGSTNTYNAADELEKGTGVTYAYNEVGELTSVAPSGKQATSYEYSQAGNLAGVKRATEGKTAAIADSYAENGLGLRASQTIGKATSYFAWDTSEGLPVLLNDGTNSYIYGPGDLPVEQVNNNTGAVLYLHHDQQGSTRLLTGSSGAVEGAYTYDAYGNQTGHTGSATTPLGYDGQYTSSDTGLIYMRARSYDPATAQFLSVDPLDAITGERYSYAGDSPLNEADPTGLSIFGDLEDLGEEVGEGIAGWGDKLTFGATKWVREQIGDENVNTCSAGYQAGGYAGLATAALIPGEDDVIGAEGADEAAEEANTVTSTARPTPGGDGAESVID